MPERRPDNSVQAHITPSYDGIFSDHIVWNTGGLQGLAEAADLRTNITIY